MKALRAHLGLVWTVTLMLKLLLFRHMVLNDYSWYGIVSDAAAVGLIMVIPACIWTGAWRKVTQTIAAVAISILWFAVAIYYSYYGNVPTYYTLSNLNQVGQIRESIASSIEPYMLLFFIDFVIVAIVLLIWRDKQEKRSIQWTISSRSIWRPRIYPMLTAVICLLVVICSLYSSRHIENSHALAKRLGVITYQLAFNQTNAMKAVQPSEEEISELRKQVQAWLDSQSEPDQLLYNGAAAGSNLIAIQVEAMQNFVIGLEVNGQTITPYLNQLAAEQSLYFPHIYQQIAEGNTSDAEFMMNTGAYPSALQSTSKQLTGKKAYSLPRLLAQHGYESYTFHVNDVTFWNRNEMYPALGFTDYFDKPSFKNDEFNSWGASDEQLFKVALQNMLELEQRDQPFYAHLVTVSSHHPFKIPEQYQMLNLPTELEDTQLGHYLQAIHYVDRQLEQFMKQLDEHGLLEKSVVAIYGDHFGLQPKDNPPEWVSEQLGIPYHETITRMNIPFFIHAPNVAGEVVEQVGGQVDMLPTVLNLLGITEKGSELIIFGSDLLNVTTNIVGARYYLPTGSFFNDEVLFIPGEGFKDGKAVSLATFEPVALTDALEKEYNYIIELMSISDQYTTLYPIRAAE
ncbi:LTA synthase family protein [Paenibacillus camelliae]|uniref:LTA synthase family protein n=1 Tax=Paenibacillus camelliae TaxID=512410 RepID=UPI00203D6E15|nr:LTA synthase family protein [Paenibacillus camelliae]MCM3633786.1 LTA synthase family protein [Paenibacillus camelliae]